MASLYLIAPSTRHKERTPNRDIRRHASAAGVPYLTANCSSNWAFYPSKMWNRWVASQHKENLGNRDRRRKEPWHKPQYTIYIEFGFSPERRHSSGSSRCSLQCGALSALLPMRCGGKARITIDHAASFIRPNSVETAFTKSLSSSEGKNEARN